jgi:hypothetical protein
MHEKSADQGRCLFSAEYLYLGLQERVLSTSKRGWTTVSMPKFLIITADDFGLHEVVDGAVEQAERESSHRQARCWVPPQPADALRSADSSMRVDYTVIARRGRRPRCSRRSTAAYTCGFRHVREVIPRHRWRFSKAAHDPVLIDLEFNSPPKHLRGEKAAQPGPAGQHVSHRQEP